MKRILIIGINGAGKSTLAVKLGEILGLEVYHLDKYYWQENWTQPDKKSWLKLVNQLVDKDSWIIDGTYPSTLELRAKRADTIILLDFPKLISGYRVMRRYFVNRKKLQIYDRPQNIKEKLHWQLLKKVILFDSAKLIQRLDQQKRLNLIVLKSDQDCRQFLQSFRAAE